MNIAFLIAFGLLLTGFSSVASADEDDRLADNITQAGQFTCTQSPGKKGVTCGGPVTFQPAFGAAPLIILTSDTGVVPLGAQLSVGTPTNKGFQPNMTMSGELPGEFRGSWLAVGPRPLGPAPFTNLGLGGGIVTVMREAADAPNYTTPIPVSVRLCNVQGGVPMAFITSPSSAWINVNMGECLILDQPHGVFFHTPTTVTVDVYGTYEIIPSNHRIPAGQAFPRSADTDLSAGRRTIGKVVTDPCYPTNGAPSGHPIVNAGYWGYCAASALTGGKNYRVCFDTGYSNQPAGRPEYTGSLLPLVLDRMEMASAPQSNPDELLYNSITAGGCRDLYGVKEAYVLITNGTWINETMTQITYRVVEIPDP